LRYAYCVYDSVVGDVGIVSLFRLNEEYSEKVLAHNLGHKRNLNDHDMPIDIMFMGLISEKKKLQNETFCEKCEEKLRE